MHLVNHSPFEVNIFDKIDENELFSSSDAKITVFELLMKRLE